MQNLKAKFLTLFAFFFGLSLSAYAALPASVTTVVDGIQQDGTDLFDATFPVIGAILGLLVVIKLFKRFISKI